LQIDFGGGIKSEKDLQIVFDCGAHQATAGSIAIKNRDEVIRWLKKYGKEKIIIGADVYDKKIAVSGWQEITEKDIFEFLNDYMQQGMKYCICTDISKDGMLQGPSTELYKSILTEINNLKLIASGGISSINDIYVLKENGLYAAIIGKAIYEHKISLIDIKNYHLQLN
jgi:phosphoribosylformimino-5-aminoimidazole carboxamide ribotide isomerase